MFFHFHKPAYTKKARDSSVTYPTPQAFALPLTRISNVEAHADMYATNPCTFAKYMKHYDTTYADIYRCPVSS